MEEKADGIFQEHRLYINSTVNNRKKNFEPYISAVEELKSLYNATKSYNIFERYFQMEIWYYELTGKFETVLSLIDKVEKDIENGKINQNRFDSLFVNVSKGNALIKLKRFEDGSIFLEKMLNEIDNNSKTWYAFAEKYIMLNIQNKQFEKASNIFFRVANNKSFAHLDENEVLKWNIFRGYLFHLTGNKKIIKKFDYKRFIKDTPVFDKRNAGYNVAIIILQILNKVDSGLSVLFNKLDNVDDYVNRYLNNSFSKRTKTFCKLLHKIAIHNRDYETIVHKSKYLQEKLQDSEIAGESYVDFEVVPYEFLWENVLEKVNSLKLKVVA